MGAVSHVEMTPATLVCVCACVWCRECGAVRDEHRYAGDGHGDAGRGGANGGRHRALLPTTTWLAVETTTWLAAAYT